MSAYTVLAQYEDGHRSRRRCATFDEGKALVDNELSQDPKAKAAGVWPTHRLRGVML